jgi:hypothetical protein
MNLSWVLKSGRPKTIKGNYMSSKIAGLALEPVTQSINRTGKVNTGKVYLFLNLDGTMLFKPYQWDTTIST